MYKQDGRTGFRRPQRRSTIPSNNRTLELPAWRATTQGPHSPPSARACQVSASGWEWARRPPCGSGRRDAWRRRGSNRSGQRGGAGVWGGGLRAGGAQRMREKRRLQRLAVARVWAGARGTYIGSTVSRGHGAGAVPEESGPGGRASELGARSRVPAKQ